MVTTYGDTLYREIKVRGLLSLFEGNQDSTDNTWTLNDILSELNLTKSTIAEVEIQHPNSVLYLEFLLQTKDGVDFEICDHFKAWMNWSGWQYGCRFDKGKGERIQVGCYGCLRDCERQEMYEQQTEGQYGR